MRALRNNGSFPNVRFGSIGYVKVGGLHEVGRDSEEIEGRDFLVRQRITSCSPSRTSAGTHSPPVAVFDEMDSSRLRWHKMCHAAVSITNSQEGSP